MTSDSDHKSQCTLEQASIDIPVADMVLWSPKEAAAMCGVKPATLRNWVSEGIFPDYASRKIKKYSADKVRKAFADMTLREKTPRSALETWELVND